jgi:hypothetical protein
MATLEQEIADARVKLAEAEKEKAKREAEVKKQKAIKDADELKARKDAQAKKDKALLDTMLATRKKLIDVIANPKSTSQEVSRARSFISGTKLDTQIKTLAKSLNIAVSGGQIVKRPFSVPGTAVYDEATGGWTRGDEKWDSAGKRTTTTAAATTTKTTQGPTGPDATLTKTRTETSAAAKAKAAKIKAEEEAAAKAAAGKTSTGPTGPSGPTGTTEVPSGFNVGSFRMAEEASMGAPGASGAPGAAPLTPFDEILAKAKATYGDIDSVFNDDPDLNALLRAAIGNVADPNDDMKDTEFLNRLKNTKWWQTSAGEVRQRGFEKRQYERLKAEIEKNPTAPDYQKKLDKLEN